MEKVDTGNKRSTTHEADEQENKMTGKMMLLNAFRFSKYSRHRLVFAYGAGQEKSRTLALGIPFRRQP